jgi:hypothetical protein
MAERYDDVRELSEPQLRSLLDHGRPEERVWALWALALHSAPEVIGAIVRRAEPDAGVRRNLAVVLAGHGELELLVGLAKRDPAPEVRAAAMQLVTRLAVDGKLPPALVDERARGDGSEVRIAILGTVFADSPPWLRELARRLLGDADRDVRYEAFEALVRAGDAPAAIAWLEEAPEAEARIALMRWTARVPGRPDVGERLRACAMQLAGASRRLRRLLIESVRTAHWRELAPVIGDDPSLVHAFARRGPEALADIPTATLIGVALREHDDTWLLLVRDRLASIDVPDVSLAPLLAAYRERCEARLRQLDAQFQGELVGTLDVDELDAAADYRDGFALAVELARQLTLH